MNSTDILQAYRAALNYALDELSADDMTLFLLLWREGDWNSIQQHFPEFDLNTLPISEGPTPTAILH